MPVMEIFDELLIYGCKQMGGNLQSKDNIERENWVLVSSWFLAVLIQKKRMTNKANVIDFDFKFLAT